jgi:hypothetical protein
MEIAGHRHSLVRDSGIRRTAGCPVITAYLPLARERI